ERAHISPFDHQKAPVSAVCKIVQSLSLTRSPSRGFVMKLRYWEARPCQQAGCGPHPEVSLSRRLPPPVKRDPRPCGTPVPILEHLRTSCALADLTIRTFSYTAHRNTDRPFG